MADQLNFNARRAFDINGNPAPRAQATFFETGTTIPVTVFSDEAGTIVLPQPVVADGAGYWPEVFYVGLVEVDAVVVDEFGGSLYTAEPAIRATSALTPATDVTYFPNALNPSTDVQQAIDVNTFSINQLQLDVNNLIGTDIGYTNAALPTVFTVGGALDQIVDEYMDRPSLGTTPLNTVTDYGYSYQDDAANALIANDYPADVTNRGYLKTFTVPDGTIHQTYYEQFSEPKYRTFVPASLGGPFWSAWYTGLQYFDFGLTAPLGGGTEPPLRAVRASVIFDTPATPNIIDAFNVSAVNRVGTGEWNILFDIDMPDTNYILVGSAYRAGEGMIISQERANSTTSSMNLRIRQDSGGVLDPTPIEVAVIR